MVTLMIGVMALGLLALAQQRNAALEWVLLALNLGTVALFLGYGIEDLGNITDMPQWTLFLAIALLIVVGKWRR